MMGAREGARQTWETGGLDGEGRHEGLDVNFFCQVEVSSELTPLSLLRAMSSGCGWGEAGWRKGKIEGAMNCDHRNAMLKAVVCNK